MNIAIYGGAFDPFTDAHLEIIARVNSIIGIDMLYIEPSHKSYKDVQTSWSHRVEIIKLSSLLLSPRAFLKTSIGFHDGCGDRQPYAFETLAFYESIKDIYNVYYVIGSDELKVLNKWKRAEEIIKGYRWVVIGRGIDNSIDIIKSNTLLNKHKKRFVILPFGSFVSSTLIRKQLKDHGFSTNLKSFTNLLGKRLSVLKMKIQKKVNGYWR